MEERMLKELKCIKNLLILSLLKSDITSEQVDQAVGMGAGNIRRMFPLGKRGKKSGRK